jgi:predicted metal-dependent hydrolase
MAATLETVSDYLGDARVLLQDTRVPYRYSDDDLLRNLNIGLQNARKLRADLFLPQTDMVPPQYTAADLAKVIPIEFGYRDAFVYYMVGRAQLRDEESTTDSRAAGLMNKFVGQLLSIQG